MAQQQQYKYLLSIIFALIIIYVVLRMLLPFIMEGFGAQGGEMVQLRTSHVPTTNDIRLLEEEEKQIKKDIVDMTGYW